MAQNLTPTTALDDVGPSPIVERVVHGVVWALLGVSIVGIAFIFGFDPGNWLSVDNASAAIRALGVDLTFYGGLYFARKFWNHQRRTFGDFLWGCFWFFFAFCAACLSWFANSLFIARQHLVTQDLLNSAGFSWVTAHLVNQVVGAIPIAIILLYSFVPRQQVTDRRTPEQIAEDAKRELALLQAKSAVEAQRASLAGSRMRGVVGGFVNQALNLEERQRQASLDEQKREERQERREKRERLRGLANIHGLDPYADDLEEQLTAMGVWNQPPAKIAEVAPVEATDTATRAAIKTANSGPLSTYFTATEVARELGKPVRTVSRWMSAGYEGPYHLRCRKIKSKGNARCTTAGEIARIKALLAGENPPMDTDEQDAQPSLAEMPVLVVSQQGRHEGGQEDGQEESQVNGHQNGHAPRQEISQ